MVWSVGGVGAGRLVAVVAVEAVERESRRDASGWEPADVLGGLSLRCGEGRVSGGWLVL